MVCCPHCGELCPDGQTRCGECGRALPARTLESHFAVRVPTVRGCTCGDNGVCTACYFAEIEGDITHV